MEGCIVTRDEVKEALMTIQVYYPNFKAPNKTFATDSWLRVFADYDYEMVIAAIDSYVKTDNSGFAPSVGEIIEKIHLLFGNQDEINDAEAWQIVWKAIRSSGDYDRAEKNFSNLPRAVQKSVGSAGQLMDWALTEKLNVEVISSNFKRTYRSEISIEKEKKKLGIKTTELLGQKQNFQIEDQKTVSDQRIINENDSIPAPINFMDRVKEEINEQSGNEERTP